MRDVVQICEPGGRILDPFAGAGTTVLAAVQEGYEAVGIEMYNIDKPQERRKATGTGGIPPENIRLRRTLTTEYLQLSLCYGVRDRMSIETAGFTGWR